MEGTMCYLAGAGGVNGSSDRDFSEASAGAGECGAVILAEEGTAAFTTGPGKEAATAGTAGRTDSVAAEVAGERGAVGLAEEGTAAFATGLGKEVETAGAGAWTDSAAAEGAWEESGSNADGASGTLERVASSEGRKRITMAKTATARRAPATRAIVFLLLKMNSRKA
ncbi:MAG: hypothetical protein A3K90_01365 [Pelodictyon luteolum]|uniref:Uncharacterized protein n=1 Tax=Pelodictyon luteolum TaxID=1100 RepID=A0A165L0A5_PELLU|nr:MAG: hypothetical protein A3K90_01365 [Pelodictyon luteolum]